MRAFVGVLPTLDFNDVAHQCMLGGMQIITISTQAAKVLFHPLGIHFQNDGTGSEVLSRGLAFKGLCSKRQRILLYRLDSAEPFCRILHSEKLQAK